MKSYTLDTEFSRVTRSKTKMATSSAIKTSGAGTMSMTESGTSTARTHSARGSEGRLDLQF